MPPVFNDHFAAQFEQLEAEFTNTNPDANAGTLPADDGIDYASLQEYLSRDSNINDHVSAAFTDPAQYQHLCDVHGSDSFPDGTCTMAQLELNRSLSPATGAWAGLGNTAAAQSMPQADLGVGSALNHDFGQGWPLVDSDLLPHLSTDPSGGQSGYRLHGSLGSAEQTEAAPSFHAGDQLLAGAPAAYQPIGYQNTLAQAGGAITGAGMNESMERILPSAEIPPRLEVLEHTQLTASWEMRNNKYFCRHAGCRNPSFKRLGDIERHQNNVHTQTKFFWCRYDGCDRGRPFPRKDKRNEHERKVHHVDYTLAENH
ncbi:putative c2h2 finger domain-containing protein [Diplodia seriata]|uniref:Putative c2h2 finger domain-containing protein n=1 Tax=Diplodia seriata TaxID=420778 RepID=A0A0G2EJ43_9PEZI|nr:putative c2h2 finger domain-containing protein [Diplodia seriata]